MFVESMQQKTVRRRNDGEKHPKGRRSVKLDEEKRKDMKGGTC